MSLEANRRYKQTEKGRAAQRRADAKRDPVKRREQMRQAHARRRARAVAALGGECAECGTTERLEIHHVHGDGVADREKRGTQKVLTAVIHGESGYRLLCKADHERTHHA